MWVELTTSEDLFHHTTGELRGPLVLFENYVYIITDMNVDPAGAIHGTIVFNPGPSDINDSQNREPKRTRKCDGPGGFCTQLGASTISM